MTKLKDYIIGGLVVLAAGNWLFGSSDKVEPPRQTVAAVSEPATPEISKNVVVVPTQKIELSKKKVVVAALPKEQQQKSMISDQNFPRP